MARVYQGAFNSGELAPGLWGRVDLERYASGLRVARNMFPKAEGGIMQRPGLEFVAWLVESLDADARLIPFKFNNEQTYMLVVSPTVIFIIKNGGAVLEDQDAEGGTGSATAVSDGTDTYVDYTGHSYLEDEILFFIDAHLDGLRGRWVKVAAPVTADRFYVKDYVTGDAINSSGYGAGSSTDFGRVYQLTDTDGWFDDGSGTPPYADCPVSEIDYTQANDTLYVSHRMGPTKVITRSADDAWTIENFDPAPSVSAPTNISDTDKPASGTISVWYVITALDPDSYEESLGTVYEVTGTSEPIASDGITLTWDEQTSELVEVFRIYKGVGGVYGLIGSVTDPDPTAGGDTLEFTDEGITPNLSIAPPLNADFFNDTGEYPGSVELFQQRIWFGGTDLLLRDIYASRSGSLSSFATSTVQVDDDPIE
jgi:hypothetical protein